ncbi:four helix bundle protein [Thermodesulfobacteriota bacterium]
MSKVEKFEDLIAWQKARELTKEIYSVTKNGEFKKDFGLRDQIQRACVSIMSNIAEGFNRASRAEFHQFLVIAKGSCAEVKTQLYIARDIGYVDDKCFTHLQRLAEEVSRIIGGLRSAVDKQRKKQ